ncbi:Uncharacterised protein [Nocardia otitidiscaviarum]|uniref:Uncharacterized protein n=1 Tax=Nocardia otitidiscaviarum TaxID=1823 RepID=A0A379JLK0_9NOCA|nr:hypothetical protein [Nocardia otitidiscaviarum]SUD49529.1 Uncharacterised protein [Nocardia otitidiscaviarum]
MRPQCPWCASPATDEEDPDLTTLCDSHAAEYEGLSLHQADRRDRIEYAEWLDSIH